MAPPAPGVDTGMGLERLASVLQQVPTNHTDLFAPIHARMRELLGHDPEAFEAERFSYQVIADHSRAATFLIADGVLPSNEWARLRAAQARPPRGAPWLLGRTEPFLAETAAVVIDTMGEAYPHLVDGGTRSLPRSTARKRSSREPSTPARSSSRRHCCRWRRASGDRPLARRAAGRRTSSSRAASSWLHDTYGFLVDLTVESAAEYGVGLDREGFDRALAEQRERSAPGKRPSSRSTPSWARSTRRSRAAPATHSSSATRRPRPRVGWSRSCATGWSSTS